MSDESFGSREQVVEADAEADLLDDLVGVLRVDVILDTLHGLLVVQVSRVNLDQV